MLGSISSKLRTSSILGAVSAILVVLPLAAFACDVGLRTDGSNVTWCYGDSMDDDPAMREAAHWAIVTLANTPAMTTTPVADCDPNVNPDVDSRFVDAELPYGTVGRTRCAAPAGRTSGVCNRYNVSQDNSNQRDYLTDPLVMYSDSLAEAGELMLNFKATWCHEVGHAMSLEHHPAVLSDRGPYYTGSGDRARDCMVRGHVETNDNWLRYNSHHVADLNARY